MMGEDNVMEVLEVGYFAPNRWHCMVETIAADIATGLEVRPVPGR